MESNSNFTKWLAVITSIFALFSSVQSYFTDKSVKALESENKRFDFKKDTVDFNRDREFKFKIYELVLKAIEDKNDTLKQNAARVVVSEMVDNKDADFKLGLLNIIKSAGGSKNIKSQASEAIYKVQEAQKQEELLLADSRIKVDVFYLEDKQNTAEPIAQQIADALRKDYNTRVRLLPSRVNKSSGYQISSNQIRFEKNESPVAEKILQTLSASYPAISFQKQLTTNITQNYLSIFISQ
ncbi:hypothetical protein SAMN04515674_11348 [Pseudarcicella hirudinis]|uniref:Uncharacterized protein n=1 Tax=Pseudarcicella hirudinis TaxID=1079859 RepID=A0A1I5X0F4_9BACT|nr:hypothetical protein [Pseudarcicella hirudinis]SFQ25361.1 hypothetical protein SAMN04515674_11348 [Pseudarcicella hirudinis]